MYSETAIKMLRSTFFLGKESEIDKKNFRRIFHI